MATKYSVSIRIDNKWKLVALISDTLPISIAKELGKTLWKNMANADDICVIDMDTGEFVWDRWINTQKYEDFEPSYDLDCGFNPYSGSYDFDC